MVGSPRSAIRVGASTHPTGYYDLAWRRIEMQNGSGEVLTQYVWGARYVDNIVQIAVNQDPSDDAEGPQSNQCLCEDFYYPVQDANFNVMGLVDSGGVLLERYEYTPYGERTVYKKAGADDALTTAPLYESQRVACGSEPAAWSLCDLGHQGLFLDKETGLYDNRRRVLDPRFARFLQRDPVGYADGMGLYEYVSSSPSFLLDPSGASIIDTTLSDLVASSDRLNIECCGEKLYDPATACCANEQISEVLPACQAPDGFSVSGWRIRPTGSSDEPWSLRVARPLARALGAYHHLIYYKGGAIWDGFAGPVRGTDGRGENPDQKWPLSRVSAGTLAWGKRAGLECKCATGPMIKDCIQSAPKGNYSRRSFSVGVNDCMTDCERVLRGCCLSGYTAPSIGAREGMDIGGPIGGAYFAVVFGPGAAYPGYLLGQAIGGWIGYDP